MALGGARPGAGRKSKAEEFGLSSKMDSIGKTEDVLQSLYEIATNPANKMHIEAAKLWLSYRLGKPDNNLDVTSNGESIVISFKDAQ